MQFAEVIYETGSKSVVSYEDLDALKAALSDQHNRAISGQAGGPTGHRAERVKSVLLYNEHPGNLNANGLLPVELLESAIPAMLESLVTDDKLVNVWELIARLRNLLTPLTNAQTTGPHDSMHLAGADGELSMDFLTQEGTS